MLALAILGVIWFSVFAGTIIKTVSRIFTDATALSAADKQREAEKDKLTASDESVVGLVDPDLISRPGTLTETTFDTTTYADRAIIKLTNSTGGAVECTGIAIRGKAVIRHAGHSGYLWEYSDYDDIEKNGERSYAVSNDYICSATQCEALGDYLWKELRPHNMYELSIKGQILWVQPGDVWHLEIDYTISGQASQAELIDTDVEIHRASWARQVGGIGETLLTVRVPSSAWSNTMSRRARLLSSGMPQSLYERGNAVIVGASTWTGAATYLCDGIDDQVQIQSAIDYINALGGGEVILTEGIFVVSGNTTPITMASNIYFHGQSRATILQYGTGTFDKYIDVSSAIEFTISDISIDGMSGSKNHANRYQYVIFGDTTTHSVTGNISNVSIYDITSTYSQAVGLVFVYGIYLCSNISKCYIENLTATNTGGGGAGARAYATCDYLNECNAKNNQIGTTGADGFGICTHLTTCIADSNSKGFNSCTNISVCKAVSSLSVGFSGCKSMQQCKSTGSGTSDYGSGATQSYADAASTAGLECADTAAGGYNS
jgi:hypothetical protein